MEATDSGLSSSIWDLPRILLQLGHRIATIGILTFAGALIAVLGANGALGPNITIQKSVYTSLLMVSFLATDFALLLGFIGWWVMRSHRRRSGEAVGLMIFTTVMMPC